MGRPSTYTPEIVQAICERLSNGEPLAAICREEGMPGASTVYDWMEAHPDVAVAIARARVKGFDAIAEETLAIADGPKSCDDVQRDKLRVETRLKLLAKWDPKRYGDRIDLNHSGELKVVRQTFAPDADRHDS